MKVIDEQESQIYNIEIGDIYKRILELARIYKIGDDSICLFDSVFTKYLFSTYGYFFNHDETTPNIFASQNEILQSQRKSCGKNALNILTTTCDDQNLS